MSVKFLTTIKWKHQSRFLVVNSFNEFVRRENELESRKELAKLIFAELLQFSLTILLKIFNKK
jgi:hypothetical protein